MYIKLFYNTDEANSFIKGVKVVTVQYDQGTIVVIYNPILSPEETRAKKIQDDEAEALAGLEEAKMHLQYLEIIKGQGEDEAKIVEGSIKGAEQNIKNYQAKLTAIELWKKQSAQ